MLLIIKRDIRGPFDINVRVSHLNNTKLSFIVKFCTLHFKFFLVKVNIHIYIYFKKIQLLYLIKLKVFWVFFVCVLQIRLL